MSVVRHSWCRARAATALAVGLLGMLGSAGVAGAETVASPPASPEILGRTRAGAGQAPLVVARSGSRLLAAVCPKDCDWASAVELEAPELTVTALGTNDVRPLSLGQGRSALYVRSSITEEGVHPWQAVVAAPLSGTEPVVAFAAVPGLHSDELGERRGSELLLIDAPRGVKTVVVGQLREDVQLCGRDTLLGPQLLEPGELRLRGIKFQRLAQAERDAAPRLVAEVNPAPETFPVLHAPVASSAIGSPRALVDSNPATHWSEKRSGDGSGEFVIFRAPPSVSLTRVHLQVRPSGASPPNAVAPKELWLATDGQLFHVTLPQDGFGDAVPAGSVFSVTLPEPVATSCLALVLEGAHSQADTAEVTLAEVTAETNVSRADLERAALELSGAEPQALAARELLASLGVAGQQAVIQTFGKLSALGRQRALVLLHDAPCHDAARLYARLIDGERGPVQLQAEAGLTRCGAAALPALRRVMQRANGPRLSALGQSFVALAPAEALELAVAELARSSLERRRILRGLITQALASEDALVGARTKLADPSLDATAALDLLRASEDRITSLQPHASAALQRLLSGAPSFRTRYLALDPLAQLAVTDAAATSALVRLLTGAPEAPVRAHAASQVPKDPAALGALLRVAEDPQVRVREAAVVRLGELAHEPARPLLVRHLERDPWPLVRAASVRALRELPPTPTTLRALAESAELDTSPEVRRPSLLSLGLLGGHEHLPQIRERFAKDEDVHVQAAAAAALGQLCDRESLDALTRRARQLASIDTSERDGILARASLGALGRLNPEDLKARLAPFDRPDAPVLGRVAASAALEHPEPCPR